ncbi:flagellar hook-basal body protein [Ammoniphilus sp. YIM 78166]|uniref:flagellar hook-basal body protein n=1 Tax=Ammoniphilus sp. YIM 78166 TaxID=1644106 RepID=UPI00106F9341|nr:flagellar hook-basal body protein [Ammoniphilus sp. YIM 78166]
MYTSMINAVSGMRSAQIKMDSIGNNVANTNTHGYKGQEISFGSILADQHRATPEAPSKTGRMTPLHLRVGMGAVANLHRYDMQAGAMIQTDVETDLYLQGNAFFQVQGDQGETRLTRMGSFQPINHGDGRMVLGTTDGRRVLDSNEEIIEIPVGYKLSVDSSGKISFISSADPTNVIDSGKQLSLVKVPNRQALIPLGEHVYGVPPGVEPVQVGENGEVLVKQGFLEGSNVDLAKEMASLIEVQRQFQLNSRALTIINEMGQTINNIYGR